MMYVCTHACIMYVCMYVCMYKCLGLKHLAPSRCTRCSMCEGGCHGRWLRRHPSLLIYLLLALSLRTLLAPEKTEDGSGKRRLKPQDVAGAHGCNGSCANFWCDCVRCTSRSSWTPPAAQADNAQDASRPSGRKLTEMMRTQCSAIPAPGSVAICHASSARMQPSCRTYFASRCRRMIFPGSRQRAIGESQASSAWRRGRSSSLLGASPLSYICRKHAASCKRRPPGLSLVSTRTSWKPYFACCPLTSVESSCSGISKCRPVPWCQKKLQRRRPPVWNLLRTTRSHTPTTQMTTSLRKERQGQRMDPDGPDDRHSPCRERTIIWAGRPGPKSRVNAAGHIANHLGQLENMPRSTWLLCAPDSIEGTRVGSSTGRCLPGAVLDNPSACNSIAKLYDPFCQLVFSQTNALLALHTDRSLTFRPFTFAGLYHTSTYRGQAQAPCKGNDHSGPAFCLKAAALLLALCSVLLITHRTWKVPTTWCTVRLCVGVYRRRSCGHHQPMRPGTHESGPRQRVPADDCQPEPTYPNPSLGNRPRLVGWLGFLLLFSLLGQRIAHRTDDHPSAPTRPLAAHGQLAVRLSAARKRSFKRAQHRVLRDGATMYRGRRHDANSLSLAYIRPSGHRRQPSAPVTPTTSALRIITWNCGGLNATRYAETMSWLESQTADPVHVLILQECHWPTSTEYHSKHWIHVYTGTGSSVGGVMIILSRQLADPSQIRFVERGDSTGRGVHAVHANGGHRKSILDYFEVVRSGHRVEPAERGGPIQADATHEEHAAVLCLHGTAQSSGGSGDGCAADGAGPHNGDSAGDHLPLHPFGRDTASPCTSGAAAPGACGGGAVPAHPEDPYGLPQRGGAVPCAAHLTAEPASDIVPFSLVAQNRTAESQQFYMLMMRLARNGLWQLIGATMRPAKQGRSPLCRHLNRLLQDL